MQEEKRSFELLPTGKPHISFSEVKLWKECSYRHNLVHIKKINLSKPSPVLAFGTAIHSAMESFLLTKEMKPEIAINALQKEWEEKKNFEEFTTASLNQAKKDAEIILAEVPSFFEKEFPEWEVVDAEHQLYESIDGHPNHAFKGFIDGVIKAKGKRGETLYWILDHKTTARGWFREKRSDDMVKAQLALYKNYWCQKNPNVSMKDVRCGFVLLKKAAKPGDHCELFSVSLGEVPIKRSLKVVSNMLTSVKRGVALKNRDACTWCEYKDTEHCS
jgi:hypothetical protein